MTTSQEMKNLAAKLTAAGHSTAIRYITNNGIRDWWMLTTMKGEYRAQYRAVGVENIRNEANKILA